MTRVAPRTELERQISSLWRELLPLETLGIHDNLFELGASSLVMLQLTSRLRDTLGVSLSTGDLFRYPTVATLAAHLREALGDPPPVKEVKRRAARPRQRAAVGQARRGDIAIIGMAGRFPGASNVAELWRNLRNGEESITRLSDEELDAAGVEPAMRRHPRFVRFAGALRGIDQFDAGFFGYTPAEARLLDPQVRLFLECAWEALEHAGHAPGSCSETIGVYATKSCPTYLLWNLHHLMESRVFTLASPANFRTIIASGQDFLAPTVSYKLDLKGPSFTVSSACSGSLVAVHLARQALLLGECDLALAGGASIYLPQGTGYLYEEGFITSADGHCRAFDARASGALFGSGAGVVVLKRLEEALAEGDHIHAVLKGSAINNDGTAKVGFAAPSESGQEDVVTRALASAGVSAESIRYVEAHGTATRVGDPIEVAGLSRVFRQSTRRKGFCGIGSLKTNIGHLDVASGIAGLIKVAMMLEHKELVPSLHFETPNPALGLAESPFYVVTERAPWEAAPYPRRAGVSAFGVGGTNAHVVLEEAPVPQPPPPHVERPWHLLCLSAREEKALRALVESYSDHLGTQLVQPLADMAFTANAGRTHFPHRLAFVACSAEQLQEQVRAARAGQETPGGLRGHGPRRKKVAFLFTGQGSQYAGMGRELYETQPTFRRTLEQCGELLRPYLQRPLLSVLFPEPGAGSPLDETAYTQPALFSVEYALAELWRSWGIEPDIVMGHSLGEYVAACVARVLSLEDALKLVAHRGRLMQALPAGGAMAAVLADETRVAAALSPHTSELSIAALNGPGETVISGSSGAVRRVLEQLAVQGIQSRLLHVSHAFHSPLLEPMLDEFERLVAGLTLSAPQLELISNLTGSPVEAATLMSARYWREHARQPVRFAQGVRALRASGVEVFLEVGPHPTLTAMGMNCVSGGEGLWLSSLRKGRSDWQQLLTSLGALYVHGAEVDWAGFDHDYPRRRVALPTYPFQRQRYWMEPQARLLSESAAEAPQPLVEQTSAGGQQAPAERSRRLRDELLQAAPLQRRALLADYLKRCLAALTGAALEDISVQQPLQSLGIDSLAVVELRKLLDKELGVSLKAVELLQAPSMAHLEQLLQERIESGNAGPPPVPVRARPSRNPWLVTPRLNPRARMRLFCFPQAGAGASVLGAWLPGLPEWLELCLVQPPGRGERWQESPFTRFEPMVEELAGALKPELDRPFAFYGHSLGALVSFELARHLRRQAGLSPVHLVVSACAAPRLRQSCLPNPFLELETGSEQALIKFLQEAGTPQVVLEDDEMRNLLLPALKADMQLFNGYTYTEEEPLDCALLALGGAQDGLVAESAVAAWRHETRGSFQMRMLPGGHLFPQEEQGLLSRILTESLAWMNHTATDGSKANG